MVKHALRQEYSVYFLAIEGKLALLATAIFALWMENYGGWSWLRLILTGNRGTVYGALASLFGSLLGFVIAAAAIVLGYAESDRLTILRSSDHYATLWEIFVAAIRCLAIATVAALVALVSDRDVHPSHLAVYLCFWAGSLASVRIFRTVWIFEAIIQIVTRPPPV